ncbi:hypothetical protein LGV61_10825 [Desulfurispirillum indicum]|uniref:hypothetical protein n=1 Tax=Desulfurispirillum indicum TaxID=936456 RepID=UPI001CFB4EE1|nr:hypothetical protein [Desulfurispirillum indicum]UCZ56209.1 hypothetical protein LGV61_10825 [Desulfurispirillum indicum]
MSATPGWQDLNRTLTGSEWSGSTAGMQCLSDLQNRRAGEPEKRAFGGAFLCPFCAVKKGNIHADGVFQQPVDILRETLICRVAWYFLPKGSVSPLKRAPQPLMKKWLDISKNRFYIYDCTTTEGVLSTQGSFFSFMSIPDGFDNDFCAFQRVEIHGTGAIQGGNTTGMRVL